MRGSEVFLILLGFGLSLAIDPKSAPRFDLVGERSINGVPTQVSSPTINVTFSDGYMDTIVLWKHYSNKEQKRSIDNDCNYLGHLLLEKDACVAMTGCIGTEDVVFTIMSKHATDSVHFVWTKEGKIHTVELDPNVELHQNDDLQRKMSQMRSLNDNVCLYEKPPSTLELKVKIAYDELFYDSVGRDDSKAWKNIKKVLTHVQAAYCHASLGTKIHINYGDTAILVPDLRTEYAQDGQAGEDYKNNVRKPILEPFTRTEMEKDTSLNLVVYLTNNVGSGVGPGQPCGPLEERYSINQCGNSDVVKDMLQCAYVLRHETGHNLGMPHTSDSKKNYPQDWDCGGGTEVLLPGSIMGGNARMEWSPCSVMAFRRYYSLTIAKNEWCMQEYPQACTPEASEEDLEYFQIIVVSDGCKDNDNQCPKYASWTNQGVPGWYCKNHSWVKKTCKKSCQLCEEKALELIEDNKLVFSVNEKKDNQFWYLQKVNPGDEFGLILVKNTKNVFDISISSCANDWCEVHTWGIHNGANQLWKIVGDDLISKWKNAKFVVSESLVPSVYTGQETVGGDIFIDKTSTPIFNPAFEECSNGLNPWGEAWDLGKFPQGKFKIKNKKNGLFLSTVGGKLKFTETEGTNSDWSVQDSNEAWGTIVGDNGKVLDLFVSQCGIDGCPVGLWTNFGNPGFNQMWRRSGNKIVSAYPGFLAQDDSDNLFAIESPSDGNKHWTRLEIADAMDADECEDLPAANWKESYGKLCDYVTGKIAGNFAGCEDTWSYCHNKKCKETCKKSCNACTANGCEDSQPASWNNNWGKLCDYVTGKKSGFPNRCDKTWNYCDNKNCGEFCKKSCNKC